jgi:hypothetical protein
VTDSAFSKALEQLEGVLGEVSKEWHARIRLAIDSIPDLGSRVRQDPFLRDCHAVLAASPEQLNDSVRGLRERWFPFHLLHEDQRKRLEWVDALQQAAAEETATAGLSDEQTKQLLDNQGLWAAVMRCPLKLTGDAAWREVRKGLAAEERENPFGTHLDLDSLGVEVRQRPEGLAPEGPREKAIARLVVYEALASVVVAALAAPNLSDAQKNMLQFFYVGGLTEDEAADRMLVSPDAAAQLKRRAVAALRAALAHPQF